MRGQELEQLDRLGCDLLRLARETTSTRSGSTDSASIASALAPAARRWPRPLKSSPPVSPTVKHEVPARVKDTAVASASCGALASGSASGPMPSSMISS